MNLNLLASFWSLSLKTVRCNSAHVVFALDARRGGPRTSAMQMKYVASLLVPIGFCSSQSERLLQQQTLHAPPSEDSKGDAQCKCPRRQRKQHLGPPPAVKKYAIGFRLSSIGLCRSNATPAVTAGRTCAAFGGGPEPTRAGLTAIRPRRPNTGRLIQKYAMDALLLLLLFLISLGWNHAAPTRQLCNTEAHTCEALHFSSGNFLEDS